MRFLLTVEQAAFAEAVDDIVESHGGPAIARAWGSDDTTAGLKLWKQLAESGLMALRMSEDEGGLDGSLVDLITVFERLGWHGVPGPLLESIVLLPSLVDADVRQEIARGDAIATAAVEDYAPFAVDAGIATHRFDISGGVITPAALGESMDSIDPARKLARLIPDSAAALPLDPQTLETALDEAALACAAMLVGAGERLLAEAVSYAKVREQFGRRIGEYQAIKHQLANVRVSLSFARPLVQGAALTLGTVDGPRDVSAAKIAAGDAAMAAARTALQVHAGIGYTAEHDLGIWLLRVSALATAWGTPEMHRARVAKAILNN